MRKLRGGTTIDAVNAGIAQRNSFKPTIGTTITTTQQPQTTQSSIGNSYNKMIGGDTGIGSGGFYNSIAGLEAASMRLADAASKRSMEESEKEFGLKESQAAKLEGYSSPMEMYDEIRKKRQMEDRGYMKSGGRWIKGQ